ncbi:hypothetical protein BIV25_21750 [Streptomyces sp. MUSC 14]|nr:hypothetical protein BIV25_21750 [Streptomyces sp. MUSC 14]
MGHVRGPVQGAADDVGLKRRAGRETARREGTAAGNPVTVTPVPDWMIVLLWRAIFAYAAVLASPSRLTLLRVSSSGCPAL